MPLDELATRCWRVKDGVGVVFADGSSSPDRIIVDATLAAGRRAAGPRRELEAWVPAHTVRPSRQRPSRAVGTILGAHGSTPPTGRLGVRLRPARAVR